ncbi:hypothetical protein [Nitrosomonas sp. ANs5]|uniref:hypothetical protein n=1 Tax=Nitrosomonas sp. ANs5 TaxID=3423941 RepID=UPI003D3440A9
MTQTITQSTTCSIVAISGRQAKTTPVFSGVVFAAHFSLQGKLCIDVWIKEVITNLLGSV